MIVNYEQVFWGWEPTFLGTYTYLTYNLGRMKFKCRYRKIRCRYRLGPRGIHNLFSYKNAAENRESFKQGCIDADLIFVLLCFPHYKEGVASKM